MFENPVFCVRLLLCNEVPEASCNVSEKKDLNYDRHQIYGVAYASRKVDALEVDTKPPEEPAKGCND